MLEKALWNNMQETSKRQDQLLDAIIKNSKPPLIEEKKEDTASKENFKFIDNVISVKIINFIIS